MSTPPWVKQLTEWFVREEVKMAPTDLVFLTYTPTNRRCLVVSSPKGLVIYYGTLPEMSKYSLKVWYGDRDLLIRLWEDVCIAYIDLRNNKWAASAAAIKELKEVRQ